MTNNNKPSRQRPTLFQWTGRHIVGIVLGLAILLLGFGINQSYQIYTQGTFHVKNYAKLASTVTEVINKKQPLSALLPQNVLGSAQLAEIPVSNGKLEWMKPPTKAVDKTTASFDYQVLPFTGRKQLKLQAFDGLKRAQGAHIQLRFSDMPARSGQERPDKINFNPIGWHNYKMPYQFEGKSGVAWLMQRGHLVGYQFCGLNDEGRNLVPETAWLNAGTYEGMNAQNQESQLYVEQLLANWLHDHPNDWLDLEVKPLYKRDYLIPEHIQMSFVGLEADGTTKIPIAIPSTFGLRATDGSEQITLKNYSPNAIIDYKTGRALSK